MYKTITRTLNLEVKRLFIKNTGLCKFEKRCTEFDVCPTRTTENGV